MEHWFLRFLLKTGRLQLSGLGASLFNLARWPLRAMDLKLFYLAGLPVGQVVDWIGEAWESEIVHRLYRGWQPVLAQLQAQETRIVLLSGTPRPLAECLMNRYAIQEAICAEPEVVQGCYTGRLIRPHPRGKLKVQYAAEWLKMHGESWEQTMALANDWPDRFLLARSRAVAILPSRRLKHLARRHHWPVVEEVADAEGVMRAIGRSLSMPVK